MARKAISLLLALLLTCGVLGACGNRGTPPATQEKETEPTMEVIDRIDRVEDGTLNLLMVGNSFCYYYADELYDLLMENLPEGITKVQIFNLYYSGCNLTRHLEWWKGNTGKYDLFCVDANGRAKLDPAGEWTLENALTMANWDYISLQGTVTGGSYMNEAMREPTIREIAATAEPLLDRFHERFPTAQLLWHRTWFFEIGRVGSDGYVYTAEDGPKYDAGMQKACEYMCNEFDKTKPYDLKMVNTGVAWAKARELNEQANVLPYGGLCARLGINKFGDLSANSGDGYHDGDIGGAQLLNAYVWYMTLTGDTDLNASTYEPSYEHQLMPYTLTKEHIQLLKQAAMSVFEK